LYRFGCSLLATLRSDSEFVGGLGIKLPCDWQTLGLLKSANARSGAEAEHTIDFASVVSCVLQSLLHLLDIVRMRNCWHFLAEAGS
jgi:hypothetical protein